MDLFEIILLLYRAHTLDQRRLCVLCDTRASRLLADLYYSDALDDAFAQRASCAVASVSYVHIIESANTTGDDAGDRSLALCGVVPPVRCRPQRCASFDVLRLAK